jgi:hypothetical protein
LKRKRKEQRKVSLFSDHNGSLLKAAARSQVFENVVLRDIAANLDLLVSNYVEVFLQGRAVIVGGSKYHHA